MRASSTRQGPPTYTTRRATVARLRWRKGVNTMTDATGDAAIREHTRHCKRKALRPRTIQARHDALIRLREWCETPLLDINRDQIEDYLDTQANDKTRGV